MLARTNFKKTIGSEEGFTLTELMVVVLIIGILISMAVLSFTSAQEVAQKATCRANLRILDGAVRTYYLNNSEDKWPEGIDDLVPEYTKRKPICPTVANDPDIGEDDKDYIYEDDHTFSCPGHKTGNNKYEGHTYP